MPINSFVRHGANLEGEAREEYRRLTTELSKLTLTFSENNLKETNRYQMLLTEKRKSCRTSRNYCGSSCRNSEK